MLFSGTTFLLLDKDVAVESAIAENGGSVIHDSAASLATLGVSHVICSNYSFSQYPEALELFLPVTNPDWVLDSVKHGQRRNYRLYSPSPLPFMDKVVLCAADNLPHGDKELMYAATRAFGGQYLDCLSRYTTHLVAVDLSNNKAVVASNIRRKVPLDIHIVLPEWLDACMRHQRHVPEEDYLLTNREVLRTRQPQGDGDADSTPENAPVCTVLQNKRVYIHSDFNASEHTRCTVETLAQNCGASVVHEPDVSQIDIYVGKFREGPLFCDALASNRVEVASMEWLYHVIMRGHYLSPLESNMLHFPIPPKPVPRFVGLRISITGISGDARHYLMQLVAAMGACFTRTLDANNDVLVCGSTSGEKYSAAVSRWKNVALVSHLWVEECFQQWCFLDPGLPRYKEIENPSLALGKTRLKREVFEDAQDVDVSGDLEIESSQFHTSQNSLYKTPVGTNPKSSQEEEQESETESQSTASQSQDQELKNEREGRERERGERGKNERENGKNERENGKNERENGKKERKNGKNEKENGKNEKENKKEKENRANQKIPQLVVDQPRERSAKQKASMKLHNDMEDLNKYTSMAKSVRKMKTYMDELESKASHEDSKRKQEDEGSNRKRSKVAENQKIKAENQKSKSTESKSKDKSKHSLDFHLKVIMTGCEQSLVLSRADVAKLAKVGISIVNEYSPKKNIDTLVAPKILRTEKFLKSLSKATRIVHPEFLVKVLERIGPDTSYGDLSTEFNIEDYALDKIVPIKKINEDLGFSGKGSGLQHLLHKGRGHVFEGLKINFSSNLNGGPDLISSILLEHGLSEARIVKLSEKSRTDLLAMDQVTLLVAHKTKDKKLVQSLKDVTVVDWDWCVKSIFHGSKQPYK